MYSHEQRKALREQDYFANVREEFKDKTTDQIKTELKSRSNNLEFLFVNALRDFNFSGIIRVSNAFCCEGVSYSGFRRFDPRGAVGTHHYIDVNHYVDENSFIEHIEAKRNQGYRFVVAEWIEEDPRMKSLPSYQWNDKTMLMLGEEGTGVEDKYLDLADDIVYVPQFGSVRSMNVASTAHIFVYDYMLKTGRM